MEELEQLEQLDGEVGLDVDDGVNEQPGEVAGELQQKALTPEEQEIEDAEDQEPEVLADVEEDAELTVEKLEALGLTKDRVLEIVREAMWDRRRRRFVGKQHAWAKKQESIDADTLRHLIKRAKEAHSEENLLALWRRKMRLLQSTETLKEMHQAFVEACYDRLKELALLD